MLVVIALTTVNPIMSSKLIYIYSFGRCFYLKRLTSESNLSTGWRNWGLCTQYWLRRSPSGLKKKCTKYISVQTLVMRILVILLVGATLLLFWCEVEVRRMARSDSTLSLLALLLTFRLESKFISETKQIKPWPLRSTSCDWHTAELSCVSVCVCFFFPIWFFFCCCLLVGVCGR